MTTAHRNIAQKQHSRSPAVVLVTLPPAIQRIVNQYTHTQPTRPITK